MTTLLFFALSTFLGIVSWFVIMQTFVWPKLKKQTNVQALRPLLAIHFFRYFGTTFLVTGVVVHALPYGFAGPAAFGDLLSMLIALLAFTLLSKGMVKTGVMAVWIFNVLGTIDILTAFVSGPILIHNLGDFGAMYIVPTVYVPLLFVSHLYIFKVLTSKKQK